MSALPRTLIVFGASGFIGRNFVNAVSGQTDRIIGVTGRATSITGCTEVVPIEALNQISQLSDDAAIVHFAAFRYDSERFELAQSDIISENAAINSRVYQFAAERAIREIRVASSVAVYPGSLTVMDDAIPVDLNAPPHQGEAFYAWSKRWLEILADLHAARFGINTIAFRLSNPYGPYDSVNPKRAHVAPAFVMKALADGPTFEIRGDPSVERDFTFVGDVVEIFRRSLMQRGRNDVYNLCTGTASTLSELASVVMKVAGVDKLVKSGASGAFGPMARRSTADRLKADFDFWPTSLSEGMVSTIEWYRHAFRP